MLDFAIRRLAQAIAVMFIVSAIVFLLMQLVPGDPVLTILGFDASETQIAEMRAQLHLDEPLLWRFLYWLADLLSGDFGRSIMYREPVANLVAARFPVTALLAVLALIVAVVVGTFMGVLSAVRRGTWIDTVLSVSANVGLSIPLFWLGVLGIYLFSLELGWLPAQGYTSPLEDLSGSIKKLVMPVFCLAVIPLAAIARQSRSAMLEVTKQDYIRTAWSKGLSERVVIMRHALKNSLIPVVTLLGVHLNYLIGGSVLIETVFNIPGMGRLIVRSVFDKDFVVVQTTVLLLAALVVVVNFIVDISYGYLDPRVRRQ